jgi:hypothetical protein
LWLILTLFTDRDLSRELLLAIMLHGGGDGDDSSPEDFRGGAGLKRSLTVWAAVGLSLALMAPSMAANINPQGASGAGRAVPLAFLIAAVGVLLVAYTFVRLCRYYRHSGSAYASVGATPGPRAGVVAACQGTAAAFMQIQLRRAIYRDLERSTGRLPLFSCDGVWF